MSKYIFFIKNFIVLFFYLGVVAKTAYAVEMMDVTFPVVINGKPVVTGKNVELSFKLAPFKMKIPVNSSMDSPCKRCAIGIDYGFLDSSGAQINIPGMVRGLGFHYGPSIYNKDKTWRSFFVELNRRAEKGDFAMSGRGSFLLSVYNDAISKYKAKTICMMPAFENLDGGSYPGLPVYSCQGLPPLNTSCDLTPYNLDFKYGAIDRSSASGLSVSQDVTLDCSGPVQVGFSLPSGGDSISLSNGMEAVISLNNHKLIQIEDISAGKHVMRFKSTLLGNPASTGPFSGASVIISNFF